MNNKNKYNGHLINGVVPGSIAEELNISTGDYLLKVNGKTVDDVFDYRFETSDEYITLLIKKSDSNEEWLLEIEKDYDEDLGIVFENTLMSDFKSCQNKCIFCFIDQMPKGMRESLYFKDDDSRLSFLQGNYITLTNMKDKDIDRVIHMHLSPINVSVHTTNPELRCKMLNNRFAGKVLEYMDKLHQHNIEMNGQIVLCKNINDGEELERSINDLEKYLPCMRSLSIVPVGLTKCREGLYPLELFTKEDALAIIKYIEKKQNYFYEKYGIHFVHASDEFYHIAGIEVPQADVYDGYIQWENGVGMIRSLTDEVYEELNAIKNDEAIDKSILRTVTIATGMISYNTVLKLSSAVNSVFPNITINVVPIKNDFFGNSVTVAGLITGQDLIAQLKEKQNNGLNLGDTLLISSNMLRTGEKVLLDDLTTDDIEKELKVNICPVDTTGYDLVQAIINTNYAMTRINDEFVYVNSHR